MKLREAFSELFGEVPETHSCHIGIDDRLGYYGGAVENPCPVICDGAFLRIGSLGLWVSGFKNACPLGPDISDRPAESFRGFFGDGFDRLLDTQEASR